MPETLLLAFALACVALMGLAIQRGATCMVAAVDELMARRSARRLAAMGEASLWVAGGLVVAQALGVLPSMPAAFAASGWTVAGGALLGLGAWLNGACVFGAIARLGSGEWAYAATPLGYYLGCLSVRALFDPAPPQALAEASPLLAAPPALALLFAAAAAWRLARPLAALEAKTLRARVWSPHAATTVIGISFLFTLLVAGAWAYTDLLADLAHGMANRLGGRIALFAALLLGAGWGGYTAGRWRARTPTAAQVAKCLAGGALMGWGTLLIPGSNDGLILVGLPLLRPYAALALAAMVATIALAQGLRQQSSLFRHGAPREDRAA